MIVFKFEKFRINCIQFCARTHTARWMLWSPVPSRSTPSTPVSKPTVFYSIPNIYTRRRVPRRLLQVLKRRYLLDTQSTPSPRTTGSTFEISSTPLHGVREITGTGQQAVVTARKASLGPLSLLLLLLSLSSSSAASQARIDAKIEDFGLALSASTTRARWMRRIDLCGTQSRRSVGPRGTREPPCSRC